MIIKNLKKIFCLLLIYLFSFIFTGCNLINNILNKLGIEPSGIELPEVEVGVGNLTSEDIKVIGDSNFSIHFLEVGNKYTGDCTYVKVGDIDILIDAGSRKNSAQTIITYIDQFCEDNTLEYVIATHAHQDHIAGFVGLSNNEGIFDHYKCEIIIDYARTNATSQIKKDYEELRNLEVNNDGATHYTALECWYNLDGAQREYQLTNDITMSILYQKFYEEETSDENDYSVCLLFTDNNGNNYLLTGDLEHEGEESLIENNSLPECLVFKGGHHGSPTSNTPILLSKIKPQIVCVCCCCGSDEYTSNIANMFPSQQFVNNIAPYTDQIYVTTIISNDEDSFTSMNGNIILYYNKEEEITLRCTNDNKKFKDTEWFKENREKPANWN